jgi:multidrug resistance efflux pump
VVLGLVLLTASLVGARLFSGSSGSGSTAESSNQPERVIGFGYIDAPDGGVRNLAPPMAAKVVDAIPETDKLIKKETTLVTFDAEIANELLKAADADLKTAQDQLEGAKQRAEQYQFDVEQQQAAVDAAENQARAANIRLKELKRLHEKNDNLVKQSDVDATDEDVKALEKKVSAEKAKLQGIKALKPQVLIDTAEHNVAAKQAQRDRADKAVKEYTIKAPSDGYVLRVLVNKGDMYSPELRIPAVVFAPAGDRIIRAEVDQEFASRVQSGARVCIQDDANNQGRWTGKVARVGDWFAVRRNVLPEPVQLHDVRTLECIIDDIKPAKGADNRPLRINQRMRVTFYPEGTEPDDCKAD